MTRRSGLNQIRALTADEVDTIHGGSTAEAATDGVMESTEGAVDASRKIIGIRKWPNLVLKRG